MSTGIDLLAEYMTSNAVRTLEMVQGFRDWIFEKRKSELYRSANKGNRPYPEEDDWKLRDQTEAEFNRLSNIEVAGLLDEFLEEKGILR